MAPIALSGWGEWYGANAEHADQKFIEASIGGSIADATRKLYSGQFNQCARFRAVNGESAYFETDIERPAREEILHSYIALYVGPLGKDMATMVGHLNDIGYFHRVKTGGTISQICLE